MIYTATGHRADKLALFSPQERQLLLDFAVEQTNELLLKHPGINTFYCGMQGGWDLAMALAVMEHHTNVSIIASVPYRNFRPQGGEYWERLYRRVYNEAKSVEIVSSGPSAIWKLMQRNKFMVDRSDLVVALWNGTQSGTGECVKYAERRRIAVENLWEKWMLYLIMKEVEVVNA